MRFPVDTNVLLYAANRASVEHAQGKQFLGRRLTDFLQFRFLSVVNPITPARRSP